MNNKFITCSVLLFGLLGTTTAFAELIHEAGHKGYFRIGAGSSGDGGTEVFQAPGAGSKYRLGNENNWIELGLYDTVRARPDGPYAHVELMVGLGGDSLENIEYKNMKQVFMEVGDFTSAMGNPKLWAGRRYYDRKASHIIDFFYLNTLQDFDGGGISDVDLGFGKLALAFGLQRVEDDSTTTTFDESRITQSRFDARLSDVEVNNNGTLSFWTAFDRSNSPNSVQDLGGYGVGVMHTQKEFFGGFNNLAVQYGRGLGRHAGKGGLDDGIVSVTSTDSANDFEDAETFRIVNVNQIDIRPSWSMMTSIVYEERKSEDFDNTDQTWLSLGARPMWFINENFRIPLEIGLDSVEDHANDTKGALLKTTVAAEFALERGFMSRPVLRLYATHANWSDDFKGQVGGDTFADDSAGWTVGVQAETWW